MTPSLFPEPGGDFLPSRISAHLSACHRPPPTREQGLGYLIVAVTLQESSRLFRELGSTSGSLRDRRFPAGCRTAHRHHPAEGRGFHGPAEDSHLARHLQEQTPRRAGRGNRSGGCEPTGSRSRPSTRRSPSRTRWRSRGVQRDMRAAILGAEGQRQSQVLTAEGDKQSADLQAAGNRSAEILKAEAQSGAIDEVFRPCMARPRPQTTSPPVHADAPQLAENDRGT